MRHKHRGNRRLLFSKDEASLHRAMWCRVQEEARRLLEVDPGHRRRPWYRNARRRLRQLVLQMLNAGVRWVNQIKANRHLRFLFPHEIAHHDAEGQNVLPKSFLKPASAAA